MLYLLISLVLLLILFIYKLVDRIRFLEMKLAEQQKFFERRLSIEKGLLLGRIKALEVNMNIKLKKMETRVKHFETTQSEVMTPDEVVIPDKVTEEPPEQNTQVDSTLEESIGKIVVGVAKFFNVILHY